MAMAGGDERAKSREISRADLFFSELKKRPPSPLNNPVWKSVLAAAGGCLLAWLFNTLMPSESLRGLKTILVAVALFASWVLAVRLLFIEAKAKVFWAIWLGIGLLPLLLDEAGILPAALFSFIFLFIRKYRPYRHLAGARQAALFSLGFVVLLFLTLFWMAPDGGAAAPIQAAAQTIAQPARGSSSSILVRILRYSLFSLRWFWFFSLFHLLFTVRLGFMRLRPKLAVAALFLVVVPVILLLALGSGALYMTLGESHTARAKVILADWADLAAKDVRFIEILSPAPFTAERSENGLRTTGRPPEWLSELFSSLNAEGSPAGGETKTPAAVYLWKDKAVWLTVFRGSARGGTILSGCPVDGVFLNRVAAILRSDVTLSSSNPFSLNLLGGEAGVIEDEVEEAVRKQIWPGEVRIKGSYLPPQPGGTPPGQAEKPSFWKKPIDFGIAQFDVLVFAEGAFKKQSILLGTSRSLSTTWQELFSAGDVMGSTALAVLITLAFVFLILEGLALTFGLRISGGITSAVKDLHDHMRSVAEGDLEAVVDIPNQDELGDLAASFNQMTTAIKRGREEALARERLEKELETARVIQEQLLPHRMPTLSGFEVSGTSLPSHEVGGDYFDFLDLETGHLAVAIADVSGKGIPAALLMANLQANLRAQELKPEAAAEVPARLNAVLVRNTDERTFVTFFFGILDRRRATLTYTNAGHNPPVLMRADGSVERLREGGLILGFLPDQTYAQATVVLAPGDLLVMFTDGITEAVDPEEPDRAAKFFGEERLIEVIRTNAGQTAGEVQAAILSAVTEHTRNAVPIDDITLVVIKRLPSA